MVFFSYLAGITLYFSSIVIAPSTILIPLLAVTSENRLLIYVKKTSFFLGFAPLSPLRSYYILAGGSYFLGGFTFKILLDVSPFIPPFTRLSLFSALTRTIYPLKSKLSLYSLPPVFLGDACALCFFFFLSAYCFYNYS